jgi:hypothetical protein
MPEFTTVSVKEAQMRTIPGRQGKFINEYADYIQQLPLGQAGKLSAGEGETALAVKRRLTHAAQILDMKFIIKHSKDDVFFWKEDRGEEQPKTKRSYTRRKRSEEETTTPEQLFKEPEEFERAVNEQTTVSDAV